VTPESMTHPVTPRSSARARVRSCAGARSIRGEPCSAWTGEVSRSGLWETGIP
jgi:hypothetical protein